MKPNDMDMIVIIPAYEPDERLIYLLKEIKCRTDYKIIVVDDGSKNDTRNKEIFFMAEEYAEVLHHIANKGKGESIKTALRYINNNGYNEESGVVVIDSDGQHKVSDMIKVCDELKNNENSFVIGSRRFKGKIPLRSRMGNIITKYVFRASSGIFINDTQTGLRAFNKKMIEFLLRIHGSRYEYEMNVLLECARMKINIIEVPIDTVYIDNNQSSHFNPALDSIRIYKEILKFSCSSFISFLIDFSVYSMMIYFTNGFQAGESILISNVTARIISSSSNFYINKKYVFKNKDSLIKTAIKYFGLAACILIMNTAMLTVITQTIIRNKMIAKVVVELTMFLISWIIQKLFVFKKGEGNGQNGYFEKA